MTAVYLHWTKRLRSPAGTNSFISEEDTSRFPGLYEWVGEDCPAGGVPANVLSWLEETARDMEDALSQADPAQRVDTWFPPDQTAGFVQRRMAQETAVHRWDAQSAHSDPDPIEAELARDGIDEMFDVHLQARREWVKPRPGSGERYHLHRTDGDGEWLITFTGDQPTVSREHAKGDVALRGSSSDLLLWLWGRIPADRLEMAGDRSFIGRWFELVPAD